MQIGMRFTESSKSWDQTNMHPEFVFPSAAACPGPEEICTMEHSELNNHLPVLDVLHSLVHVGCGHPEVCDQHVGKYRHSSDGTQT